MTRDCHVRRHAGLHADAVQLQWGSQMKTLIIQPQFIRESIFRSLDLQLQYMRQVTNDRGKCDDILIEKLNVREEKLICNLATLS